MTKEYICEMCGKPHPTEDHVQPTWIKCPVCHLMISCNHEPEDGV